MIYVLLDAGEIPCLIIDTSEVQHCTRRYASSAPRTGRHNTVSSPASAEYLNHVEIPKLGHGVLCNEIGAKMAFYTQIKLKSRSWVHSILCNLGGWRTAGTTHARTCRSREHLVLPVVQNPKSTSVNHVEIMLIPKLGTLVLFI